MAFVKELNKGIKINSDSSFTRHKPCRQCAVVVNGLRSATACSYVEDGFELNMKMYLSLYPKWITVQGNSEGPSWPFHCQIQDNSVFVGATLIPILAN